MTLSGDPPGRGDGSVEAGPSEVEASPEPPEREGEICPPLGDTTRRHAGNATYTTTQC